MVVTFGGDKFQIGTYVGINLQDILYGVELVLYFMTMHKLLAHQGRRKKSELFYAVFSTVMLINVTIWVSTQAGFGQHMWLLNVEFPGDPNAYWAAHISDWYMELGTTAMVVLQLMTDALMIYRCWIVWNSYYIIIVPSILWMVTLVLGILVIWANSTQGGIYLQNVASNVCLAYFGMSMPLTAIMTSMICYRILRFGRLIEAHLGHEYASLYFAIASLVVESVLPYALSGIAFLIALGVGAQIVNAIAYTHIQIMCISPQLLILRVAMGTAWTNETCKRSHSTIKFSPQSMLTGTDSEGSEVLSMRDMEPTRKGDSPV